MLIKFDADDKIVDQLKAMYLQRVASKAFYMAAADAPLLVCQVDELRDVVEAQRIEIGRLRNIIEQARASAAQLLEKTAQGDLIDG